MVAAQPNEVRHALRVAGAAVVCLLLAEWWHLGHAALAVLTTYMVLAQYAYTAFQKGVERVAGRGLGIVLGLAIVTLFPNAPLVGMLVKAFALLAFFYVHFSGRLAYTFLNAGLFRSANEGGRWRRVGFVHAGPAALASEPKNLGTVYAVSFSGLYAGDKGGQNNNFRLLVTFPQLETSFTEVTLRRDPACPVCGENPSITEYIDYVEFCAGRPAHA